MSVTLQLPASERGFTTMALILRGQTPCAICDEVLAPADDIVATSAFISDPRDPLWPFSDAGMHRRCFHQWQFRSEFVRRFNETVRAFVSGNGSRHHMRADGTIVSVPADDDSG